MANGNEVLVSGAGLGGLSAAASLAADGFELDLGPSIRILPHLFRQVWERAGRELERMGLTDLRAHVVTEHVLVPDDLQRMYYSNEGSIQGVVSNRKRNLAMEAPEQSPRCRNLFFVCGSIDPGGGTPMVTPCGQLVADRVGRERSRTGGADR